MVGGCSSNTNANSAWLLRSFRDRELLGHHAQQDMASKNIGFTLHSKKRGDSPQRRLDRSKTALSTRDTKGIAIDFDEKHHTSQ